MVKKFTKKFLDGLKPDKKDCWVREGKGFSIRFLPSGIKVWYFIYTFEGRKRYMPLGNYPEVSIEDARERHGDAWKTLKNGTDPLTVAEQAKDERLKAPTITDLATDYIEKYAKKQKKSWQEDERMLNKEVVPFWGKIKAIDISKRDVVLLLEKVSNRNAPVMANRLYALIKKMFSYAISEGYLEFSPCSEVKRPNKESSRERALSNAEIKELWRNLDKADIIMSSDIKKALKLILITAQRPGEVIGMHAKEIEGRWWTIPKSRTKTDRTHRVYLTNLALELIGDIKGRSFIFNSPVHPDKPIGEKALACALRRNIKGQKYRHMIKRKTIKTLPENPNRLKVDHFTPHDLRRTATTLMAQCGIPFEHRERVASHSMGKMDKTYNQHDFDNEKQKALETLENKIKEIIAPPKRSHYRLTPDRKKIRIIYNDQGVEIGTEPV